MKKILLSAGALFSLIQGEAQMTQGKVVYERVLRLQGSVMIRGNDNNPELMKHLAQPKSDRFELLFGNNQSLWQKADDDLPADETPGNGPIRTTMIGGDDISFVDLNTGKKTDQVEVGGKSFIVEDSTRQLAWKLTDETKTILGHVCKKATAEVIGKRLRPQMVNGEIKRIEEPDTTRAVAWFAADIPVFAGPQYPKQLPGLILELDNNNGRVVYRAVELTDKADVAKIKIPQKGKKVTVQELQKEREALMQQMQQNAKTRGFNVVIGG